MHLFFRSLLLLVGLTCLLANCAKWKVSPYDLLPQALTGTTSSTATTSVTVQAQVGELGPNTLQEFGIVYSSTNQTPTLSDTKVPVTGTSGTASVTLSNLLPNTTYYYRTYATNNKNLTGYGEVKSFKTAEVIAQVETLDPVGTPASTSAQVQCQVTNASSISLKEYGIVYSTTNQNPLQGTKVVAQGGKGEKVTLGLTGLQTNTTYYYQAYAITNSGTPSNGGIKSFKTGETLPIVVTLDPVGTPAARSIVVQTQVTNAANVSLKEIGICFSRTAAEPTVADETTRDTANFTSPRSFTLNSLGPATRYTYRGFATTTSGTVRYGDVKSFTTAAASVTAVTLDPVGAPFSTSALVQCQVGNPSNVTLKEYGIVYSATNAQPTTADGVAKATGSGGVTSVALTNLLPNTTYTYRAYVIGSDGVPIYGDAKTFKTQIGWVQVASFPGTARSEMGVIVIGSKAYLVGGLTGTGSTTYSNEVWEYDATSNKWTQKANIPRRVAYGKGFSYNGSGYLVGYTDEARTAYGELLVYNPGTDTWSTLINASLKRILVNLAQINNKVYIAGGQDQSSIIEYTIDTKATRTIASTQLAELLVGVMFQNGTKVYIGNGLFYKTNSQTKSAFELSPTDGDKLSNKSDMPQTQMIGGVVANNRTFAIGTTDSRLFEFKNDQWSLVDIPVVISPRGGGAFFSIGNVIYYGFGYPNFPSAEPTNRKTDMWAISF
jgi:hypothetical protein